MRRFFKRIIRPLIILIIATVAVLLVPRLFVILDAQPQLFTVATAPPKRVAIVFGAGLQRDGRPSPELGERVTTAAQLYFAGKVEKLLMSGDNRFVNYNEPGAMQKQAIQLGVPSQAIVLDYAGRRTYDTCYRANYIFGVRDAILVTQSYHLPRALYTCNMLGTQTIGVPSDRNNSPYIWGNMREVPATFGALLDVHVLHPLPVLGKQEPIFPTLSQTAP